MNDSISRQEVIDVLGVGAEILRRVLDDLDIVGAEREKYEWGLRLIESYIADVKELPSAQPQRKRAYLINPNPYGKCSNCGHLIDIRDKYNFCPNCGADIIKKGAEIQRTKCLMDNYKPKPIEPILTLPTEDDILIHNILYILSKAGVYGEDATIQLISILKDMGRNDLLPGCCNERKCREEGK